MRYVDAQKASSQYFKASSQYFVDERKDKRHGGRC
jgi:hypothetical protein